MFIKSALIENYKIFQHLKLGEGIINVPDGTNEGSGLTIFVGENGTGKTSLLEALSFPLMEWKAENIEVSDFSDYCKSVGIRILANTSFTVAKTMPRSSFQAVGFQHITKLRAKGSSTYLVSPLVSDTKFIPSSTEGMADNDVNLRVSVNNPFSGSRFSENDYLFIDKNRTKQLESGTFSSTRFDRILDNFNYLYLKTNSGNLKRPNSKVKDEIDASGISNSNLEKAFEEFKNMSGYEVDLSFVHDALSYKNSYLTYADGAAVQLPVTKMGSGYQMFLAILTQYYMSLQGGKQLILFIDEAELHLHNKIQRQLASLILRISKDAQVILTTHSAQLLKDFNQDKNHKVNVLKRDSDKVVVNPVEDYVLATASVNEVSYVALGMESAEYFMELYSYLSELLQKDSIGALDALIAKGEPLIEWERDDGSSQKLTAHSCLRNKIHHPYNTLNDSKFDIDLQLGRSIQFLRAKIKEIT